MSLTKVLLADFQYLTRDSIASLVKKIPGFNLVGEVNEAEGLIDQIRSTRPNLLILESHPSTTALVKEIKGASEFNDIHLLVLTNNQDPLLIQDLLKMGVKGILTKRCGEDEITRAIKTVPKGERFFCNRVLEVLIEDKSQDEKQKLDKNALSARELEILKLIAYGNSTNQIAQKLYISVHTVNTHRKNILKKLNLNSPIQLVAYAHVSGLVRLNN